MKELVIEAKSENLDAVLGFIFGEMEAVRCPAKLQAQISIATEEIFVNIAHYAYNPNVGCAMVRVVVDDNIITLEFEDSGSAYDPLAASDPDTTLSVDERDIGGLGVFMVKNIMDSAEYRREGKKNILTIKKSFNYGSDQINVNA